MPVLSPKSKVTAAVALAVVVATAMAILMTERRPHQVDPLPITTSPKAKPVVIALSKWSEAVTKKAHRRLVSYDPGITGGAFPSQGCKDCDGMGGQYVPEKNRREGDSDMTTCDTCQGTGDRGLD